MSKQPKTPDEKTTLMGEDTPALNDTIDTVPTDEVSGLQTELDSARLKIDEHWNEVLRSKAELENIQRRSDKQIANAHRYALEKFIKELLPIVDSLERGLSEITSDDETIQSMQQGMQMTLDMFIKTLEKFGVSILNPHAEKFNPEHHEAMTMQPSDEHEPNTIIQVIQKGYLLNDRLIRPAMVIVAK